MFDNGFLASTKQLKMCPRYYNFPIKQEDICYYNTWCFMSSGLIIDNIIMNLFTDCTERTTDSVKKDFFSKIQDDTIQFCKGSLQDLHLKFSGTKRH